MMKGKTYRLHGKPPNNLVVVHGGPGAPGGVQSVATELSKGIGALEPFLLGKSIDGQVEELDSILVDKADLPVTIIGHSWGAWLSIMFTARYPEKIAKLILVGAGSFSDEYNTNLMSIRMGRLSKSERLEVKDLSKMLHHAKGKDLKEAFGKIGRLMTKADSFNMIGKKDEVVDYLPEVFSKVWKEAAAMRKSGELIRITEKIKCPVIAIHGDFDPHPARGVIEPLSQCLSDFRYYVLKKCGHYPWNEKYARDDFFEILNEEIKN